MKVVQGGFWIMIVMVLVAGGAYALGLAQHGQQPLANAQFEGSFGGSKGLNLRQKVEYQTRQIDLPDGMVKSETEIKSPVGAKIMVTTASADTVTVRNVWQEGKNTYFVLAPIETSSTPEPTP